MTKRHVYACYACFVCCRAWLSVDPGWGCLWYDTSASVAQAGFEVRCIHRADASPYLDRVNMYASFYVALRKPKLE